VRAAMKVMMKPNKARRASGAGSIAIGADAAATVKLFVGISLTTGLILPEAARALTIRVSATQSS
jgi:hypothetical protein